MNTKVEEALDVWEAGDLGYKELCYRKCDADLRIAQQDATIARIREALFAIGNTPTDRYTNDAAWAQAMFTAARAALNQEQVK